MRLIDADALKVKVEAMVTHKFSESDYEFGGNQAFDYVADILIDEAPTIEPSADTKSCGVSADKSTEQNVADVPSGDLISRAEAIAYIDRVTNSGLGKYKSPDYIRKYISALPSADRPIIEHDKEWIIGCIKHDGFIKTDRFDKANNIIVDALESCDRPSGEWLYEESGWYGGDGYRCSVCKYGYSATAYHEPYEWHYCPNCGAEMKGGAE